MSCSFLLSAASPPVLFLPSAAFALVLAGWLASWLAEWTNQKARKVALEGVWVGV